jgi:hypothetical protein
MKNPDVKLMGHDINGTSPRFCKDLQTLSLFCGLPCNQKRRSLWA